jgi:hypothetical protein
MIPAGVAVVGEYAFYSCRQLSEIIFSGNTEVIKYDAFGHTNIKTLILPNSLRRIEECAFTDCYELQTVYLGNSLAVMGENPFANCVKLTGFTAGSGCKVRHKDGVLFDETMETLICYPAGRIVDSYTIPQGVKTIGEKAFSSSSNSYRSDDSPLVIRKLVIPDSVVSIKDYAFECACSESVTFGSHVEDIGQWAFGMCNFKSLTLPDSLKRLAPEAFWSCDSLTSVVIPKNVSNIESAPFNSCQSLQSIQVASGNRYYKAIDGVLYTADGKTLIDYPANKKNTHFAMPIHRAAYYRSHRTL